MIFLAIDTALQATSAAIAALAADGSRKVLSASYLNIELTHSETTQALVEKTLQDARLALSDVDCFVAVSGPGSFTGLRIGVTMVKTLAYSLNKPCMTVNSLDCLTYGMGVNTLLCPLIDARNERVFTKLEYLNEDLIAPEACAFNDWLAKLAAVLTAEPYKAATCTDSACVDTEHNYDCMSAKTLLFLKSDTLPWLSTYESAVKALPCRTEFINVALRAENAALSAASRYFKQGEALFVKACDLQPTYYALSQAERQRQA